MIKNVIFDLGNVLVSFAPMEYVCSKIEDKSVAQRIYDSVFRSKEWLMLDRGVKTEEEAFKDICSRNTDVASNIIEVMKDWHQMLTPMEETIKVLNQLKASGYKLYFLSNYQTAAFEYIKDYELFSKFDGGILSCNVNLLKPEKEIYEALMTKYGILPEESVFIDDTPENVKGARAAGIEAIQFCGVEELMRQFSKYNILV